MKTPIEPKDIKAGDLIRWESPDGEEAHETRISNPLHTGFSAGNHYLLDRPAPTVDLPTEPTLGWVRTPLTPTTLGFLGERQGPAGDRPRGRVDYIDGGWNPLDDVVAFTPATAVPTSALNELRRAQGLASQWASGATARMKYHEAITAFLAAIDAAGDPR